MTLISIEQYLSFIIDGMKFYVRTLKETHFSRYIQVLQIVLPCGKELFSSEMEITPGGLVNSTRLNHNLRRVKFT